MKKLLILFILLFGSYVYAFNPFVVFSGVPAAAIVISEETLYPDGDSMIGAWASTDTTHYTEIIDSDTATHVRGTNNYDRYTLENTSDSSGKTITKITVHVNVACRNITTTAYCCSTVQVMIYPFGDTMRYYTVTSPTAYEPTYIERTYSFLTNPADSEAWTSTDIDSLLVGIATSDCGSFGITYCSKYWVVVEYEN